MKRTTHFLIYIVLIIIPNLVYSEEQSWKTYRNEKSHVEFIYPPGWVFEPCISGYKNAPDRLCIGFQSVPLKQAQKQDYDILFELRPLSLENTLKDDFTFDNDGAQWTKYTKFGVLPVKKISGKNWQGVYVVGDCKTSDDAGAHAAGECLMLIMGQENRSAIFETSSAAATEIVMTKIVPSFNFMK